MLSQNHLLYLAFMHSPQNAVPSMDTLCSAALFTIVSWIMRYLPSLCALLVAHSQNYKKQKNITVTLSSKSQSEEGRFAGSGGWGRGNMAWYQQVENVTSPPTKINHHILLVCDSVCRDGWSQCPIPEWSFRCSLHWQKLLQTREDSLLCGREEKEWGVLHQKKSHWVALAVKKIANVCITISSSESEHLLFSVTSWVPEVHIA